MVVVLAISIQRIYFSLIVALLLTTMKDSDTRFSRTFKRNEALEPGYKTCPETQVHNFTILKLYTIVNKNMQPPMSDI